MAQQRRIGKHATTVYQDGKWTCVKYHATDVVKFKWDEIILNSGGWLTATTKTRMNQTSNQFQLGFSVFQENWNWFVNHLGKTVPFYDGMRIARYL